MPELPEVETIRRQIAPLVQGQLIYKAVVHRLRAIRAHGSVEEFTSQVEGKTILEARRRGKVLLLPLDSGDSLLVRLGMSGQVVVTAPDEALRLHTHVILTLGSGKTLRYIDPRTFGQMAVVTGQDPDTMPELSHYGVEPLSEAFTPDALREILHAKKHLIQSVLMDQAKIVGIGKIYADEACFLAGIDPRRQALSLDDAEMTRLHTAIRQVLLQSIEANGTSGKDGAYRDARGSLGEFQFQLFVYQRAGQPCRVCGTPIEFRPLQGRRMHFCPHCQR